MIRINVADHAESSQLWRALVHVPPELVPPMEVHLDGYGYLWSLTSRDGQLAALREAPTDRAHPGEAA